MGESESLLVHADSPELEFYAPKRVRGQAPD
jgi:hypothetical protein